MIVSSGKRNLKNLNTLQLCFTPTEGNVREPLKSFTQALKSWLAGGHGWRWWAPLNFHLKCGLLSVFSYESFCNIPVLKNTVIKLGPLFHQYFVRLWRRTGEGQGTGSDLCSSLPVVNCSNIWTAECISRTCRLGHEKLFWGHHMHIKK